MIQKKVEWQYIISPDEIYFNPNQRYPLQHVMQVTLERAKSDSISITGGAMLLFIDFFVLGIDHISLLQALIFIIGIFLIGWGIYKGLAYEVGFIILKDPKRYEKEYYTIHWGFSYTEAEQKLHQLWEELKQNGREKVRIVKSVRKYTEEIPGTVHTESIRNMG